MALTTQQGDVFDAIRNAGNIVLVETELDGETTTAAVVCDGDDVEIHPLAVLVTPDVFGRLTGPTAF